MRVRVVCTSHNKLIAEICTHSVWVSRCAFMWRMMMCVVINQYNDSHDDDDGSDDGERTIINLARNGATAAAHTFIKFMRFKMNFEQNENVNDT